MQPPAQSIAVFLYDGCTIAEVIELATRLERAGAERRFVSIDGQPMRDQSGLHIIPDSSLRALDRNRIDAVIVPGGDTLSIMGNAEVGSFLQGVDAAGGLLAGICAGVLVLADAGLVAARRITHNYRRPWARQELIDFTESYFIDAHVEPDVTTGVVSDGNIITALPNATVEFALTVLGRLGLVDQERAGLLQRHLRGDYVDELFET